MTATTGVVDGVRPRTSFFLPWVQRRQWAPPKRALSQASLALAQSYADTLPRPVAQDTAVEGCTAAPGSIRAIPLYLLRPIDSPV